MEINPVSRLVRAFRPDQLADHQAHRRGVTATTGPGGRWRFVEREAEGNEYGFHGVYHDLQAPERIVYTFEYEGMPGHVLLETIVLEDQDGRTLMTDTSVFQSVADRDGMLQSGMESGAAESFDRLDDFLARG